MNLWWLVKIVLLLSCCLVEQIQAGSIVKDLVILHILKNIIKPRFVPLPIPLPLPIKFTKNSHRAYPVPTHSHSLSAHEVGHSLSGYGHAFPAHGHSFPAHGHSFPAHGVGHLPLPLSFGAGHHGSSSLSHHDFSEISHLLSASHEASHSLPSTSGAHLGYSAHHELPHLSQEELATISKLIEKSELIHKHPKPSKHLLKALDHGSAGSSYYDLHLLKNQHQGSELLHSYSSKDYLKSQDDSSDLYHDASSLVGNIHDEIDTIGNFGLFDHLHGYGSPDWW